MDCFVLFDFFVVSIMDSIQCHAFTMYGPIFGSWMGVKNWLNMDVLKIPLKVIDGNKMQLDLDLQVYSIETIDAAAYKFTDNFYIFKSVEPDDKKIIHLLFEAKDENVIKESTVKQFCNELLDQQVRFHVNKQFGHIRDLIVEEAFKPVNS